MIDCAKHWQRRLALVSVATLLTATLSHLCTAAELSEAEVDRLCPPRPETAAEFKAGTYPPAARPYREAALKAFAYMASLPAMRTLVEKGEPEQTYQHNAYVSKTHAAHINYMLEWAQREPARREEALALAKASAEYLLTQLEPSDAPLAWWPPTYGRTPLRRDPADGGKNRPAMVGNEPEGAVKYRGEVMLIYPADVGTALVAYYRVTHDRRFLDAARGIAETYLKIRRPDGSWPLKMRLATGEPIGENTLVPTRPLVFFHALAEATGDDRWAKASDACFAWLEAHPLTDWNWDGQFEDIQPRPPYANPTKHNAVDAMLEILRRFPGDKARIEQCRRILRFCERRFVCWERPANHPHWDVPSVLEQYSCFVPIDASAAKMIRAYLALWRATGEPELLAKARALGDTITRVQTPEGRIPTFWTHDTLSAPLYDWLNCVGSSAHSLLQLADATDIANAGWKVPGWEVRVTETGAIKEWTGKTWCGHIQGMCATSNALYFAFHNQIVKTDWCGRLLKRAENLVKHTGDICYWKGHLYTIVCHVNPVPGVNGAAGSIQMFDEDLNLVKERSFIRPKGAGGDGIACLDGVLYIGLSTVALPGEEDRVRHCARYRKFDATTLEDIGDTFTVDHHSPLYSTGQQNITTDGTYIYVASDTPDEGGCNFFKFDRDFNVLGKWSFGWFQGVDVVPGGKDGAVRFVYCSTPNWMKPRDKPPLSVHALVLFAELKDGKIRDITRHCVFKNEIPR